MILRIGKKNFTLIELLVVIAIIAILARRKAQTDDLHHRQLHLGGKLYLRSLQGSLGH